MKFWTFASAITALSISIATNAAPVLFTYTGHVTSSHIDLVSVGNTVTLDIIADNGNSSLQSQTWSMADTISATITVGSYQAHFIDNWFNSSGFKTDATGSLTSTNWFGTNSFSPTSSDNYGSGIWLANGSVVAPGWEPKFYYDDGHHTVSAWSNPVFVSSVPIPGAIWLLGSGLAGLVCTARKRKSD